MSLRNYHLSQEGISNQQPSPPRLPWPIWGKLSGEHYLDTRRVTKKGCWPESLVKYGVPRGI
ncbi:MAG: hypothetical protein DRG83_18445 [Deltaproteobacteria bacterium]|nr:MAG: hypothetical protein DRG83_18445 [Deltaproteobacteria bacterium]